MNRMQYSLNWLAAIAVAIVVLVVSMTAYEALRAHEPQETVIAPIAIEMTLPPQDGPPEPERRSFDRVQADVAWKTACEAKKVDCLQIPQPAIAWAPLATAYGQYHMGDSAIVMDASIRGQSFAQYVMLHEMIHYLQHYAFGREPAKTQAEACVSEKDAVETAYAYAASFGVLYDNRVSQWGRMGVLYKCTTPGETPGLVP